MPGNALEGRRIIVTGGASGMGETLIRAFPGLGAKVVSLDMNETDGTRIAKESQAIGFVSVDVSNDTSVGTAVAEATKLLGGLDVLIHAAGIAPSGRAEETSFALWNKVLAINATGTFLMNQAVFPYLRENGGAIINFASAAGVMGYPTKVAYAAAKGAVVALNRSLAQDWGKYNITVNAVAPAIWTPMYDKTRSELSAEMLQAHDAQMTRSVPIGGKLGDLQKDFLPVMVFLASDGARFLTGQIIPVDGGALMVR